MNARISSHKANPSVADLKVNDLAVIRPAEVPLYVGPCAWKYMGTHMTMSVSTDKGWFWVRFSADPLPPHYDAEMRQRGWFYSKKKRHGYWQVSTPEVAKFLRSLGFHKAQHTPAAVPTPPTKLTRKENEVTMPSEHTHKGTLLKGVHQNSKGRWVDEDGRFISNERMVEYLTTLNGTNKSGKVFTPPAPEVDEDEVEARNIEREAEPDDAEQYEIGYQDGLTDGENEEVPPIYNRMDFAKYVGMTVANAVAALGDPYLAGYLEGFEIARPKPQAKGALARIAELRRNR